jgi:hypothetical protein
MGSVAGRAEEADERAEKLDAAAAILTFYSKVEM